MIVVRKFFEIIPDNEEVYFSRLIGFIDSLDELSKLQITKQKTSYQFRLSPSVPKYNNLLIKELINFHNLYHIRLDISKSIKASGTLYFKISFVDTE